MNPIKVDPEIMGGTPCFAGTRVPIKNLFDHVEGNYNLDEIFEDFPAVSPEQVKAVLEMARRKLVHG